MYAREDGNDEKEQDSETDVGCGGTGRTAYNPSGASTTIADEAAPTSELPDITDIIDEDTPMSEFPDDGIDIPDEDVPMAAVPQTGDGITAYGLSALFSGIAFAWMTLAGRKRKEEEAA